jgi:hypothetical protein
MWKRPYALIEATSIPCLQNKKAVINEDNPEVPEKTEESKKKKISLKFYFTH